MKRLRVKQLESREIRKFQLSKHPVPCLGCEGRPIDLKSRVFLPMRKMTLEQPRIESSHNFRMKSSGAEFF